MEQIHISVQKQEDLPEPVLVSDQQYLHMKKQEMISRVILAHYSHMADTSAIENYLYRSIKFKENKPCLQCGKEHQHNNDFCSAECCVAYKAANRSIGKVVLK